MPRPVSIALVGIGGMGSVYLAALLENKEKRDFRLVGAVDPQPQRCPQLAELRALDIPVFEHLEEFYRRHRADLAIIASPIHFHCAQTCLALSRGSCVLCEKPAAATVQEVNRMREAEQAAGRWVAVGFQWSFSTAIQALKNDLQAGMYGRPLRLKCLYLWPRKEAYYRRNDWAGKVKDAEGRWILDSPANNAMAHDLHNMFYVLGRGRETAARPVQVEAELYRAHEIENFDTAALRCLTADAVEVLFYVSHVASVDSGPIFSYEFERGKIRGSGRDTDIKGLSAAGEKNYGSPDREPLRKMWEAIDSVDSRGLPACGLEAAMGETLAVNGAQDSMPEVQKFPGTMVVSKGEPGSREVTVAELAEVFEECYRKNALPSELGVSWSRKGRLVSLTDYVYFPGGS
jgi:predicted dehydrogenase